MSALVCACASAAALPAGTQLAVRLKSTVASNQSKPKDQVEATLVQPVVIGTDVVIPAGVRITGEVTAAQPAAPDGRAALEIHFSKLEDAAGKAMAIDARVAAVDNARESIEKGRIVGILPSETLSARLDQEIAKLQQKSAGFAGFLQTVKQAVLKEPEPEIVYGPGTDLTLELEKPFEAASGVRWPAQPDLRPIEPQAALLTLVNAQPIQTVAGDPPKPSDITTLMFLGTRDQLEKAFAAAGWHAAAALNAATGLETVRAVAEMRGYQEAPVSLLLLDGQKPELVFQKQNNTFAKRHHLRIWKRPGQFGGRSVWVCAATHDIGISFSAENRTFIHLIDPEIDRERAKVVNDLLFSGHVSALALVDRPNAPRSSQNATGDKLETDGRMAVLALR